MQHNDDSRPVSQSELYLAWTEFTAGKEISNPDIPAHVIKGWHLSRLHGVNPLSRQEPPVLEPQELQKLYVQHAVLLECADPILKMLEASIRGTGYIATLAIAEGYLLRVVGDDELMEQAWALYNIPGADRRIETVGSSALALSISERKPIQIVGFEHYNRFFHHWHCAAAPIYDLNDRPIASLAISSEMNHRDSHTLLLSQSCAACITIRLREHTLNLQHGQMAALLGSVLDSLPEAVISLDCNAVITHANSKADAVFCGPEIQSLVGRPMESLICKKDIARFRATFAGHQSDTIEIETLGCSGNNVLCRLTPISSEDGKPCGMSVSVSTKKQLIDLAKHVGGNNARYCFDDIKGESPALKQQIQLAKRASGTNYRVLITGESGTGKELFAQSIHNHSAVRNGPFVAISCAAIPRDLIESELFGYVGGAFTGARRNGMIGRMELASGGTLFLDEINSLPLEMQAKFLRALQQREIIRIGDSKPTPIDICLIAATNQDLKEAVSQSNFREDLYYRLNVIEITIPPLRERAGDIPLLTDLFMRRLSAEAGLPFKSVDGAVMDIFRQYPWPGNVRQLSNVCERALLMSANGAITVEHLPHDLQAVSHSELPATEDTGTNGRIKDVYKDTILAALAQHNGNISKAAGYLGVARSTLYRNMKKLGIPH